MAKIYLPSNHYLLSSASQVKKICRSLFEHSQFSYFDYGRFYQNGQFYGLGTNKDYFYLFLEIEYEALHSCKNFHYENDKFYYFFGNLADQAHPYSFTKSETIKLTGSSNSFGIFQKTIFYVDIYFFSAPLPAYIAVNYYLNQLPLLYKFIAYFKEVASPLLIHSSENKILLPTSMVPQILHSSSTFSPYEKICKNMHLSQRELQCLHYICKGYTAKEIGSLLSLSSRTIESYLCNLKIKFNVRKKTDIVKYITALSNEYPY